MVGTSSEMMLTPFGALAAGFLAGTVSTLGYKFFTVQMPPPSPGRDGVSRAPPPASLTGLGWEGHTRFIIGVLSSSPSWSQNSKFKTRVVSTTFMGCLGSWEPCWGSSWLGWPLTKLTEMGKSPTSLIHTEVITLGMTSLLPTPLPPMCSNNKSIFTYSSLFWELRKPA